MRGTKTTLNRLLEHITIALFAVLCTVVFGEVVARYVFNRPYFWSEEVTVYTFTWVAFLGSAMALRDNRHIGISYFVSLLPLLAQRVVAIIADLIVLAFLGLLLVQSVKFCLMNHSVASIALQIPLSYVSGSLVVMTLFMAWYAVEGLLERIRALRAGTGALPAADLSVIEKVL